MLLAQAIAQAAEIQNSPPTPDPSLDSTVGQMLQLDVSGWASLFQTAIAPKLLPAAVGLGVIFMGYFLAKYIARVISQPVCQRVDETLGRFVGTVIYYCIMLGVLTAVASKLGAPLGGMAAMLAAAGFAIGLAFQGTLSNFASGVLMIVFRPFKVGDVVNIAGVSGRVNEIDLFTTTLDTPDNRRLIIPNSSISGGTIENVSYHAHRRVEIVLGVDYQAEIDATRKAFQAALDVFVRETIHGEGRGTAVVLHNLGDSAVEWKVRMWVHSDEYWTLKESLTAELKRKLDEEGIGIPYPQMDVHLTHLDAAEAAPPSRPKIRPSRREAIGDHHDHPLRYAS